MAHFGIRRGELQPGLAHLRCWLKWLPQAEDGEGVSRGPNIAYLLSFTAVPPAPQIGTGALNYGSPLIETACFKNTI